MTARGEHFVAELQGRPAGVVTRSIAGAVDYLVVWAVVGGGYVGYALLLFLWQPVRFSWPSMPLGWFLVSGFVLMIAYLWAAWSTRGKTIGSVLLGTRVVSIGGGRLDPLRALARAAFVTIFPIGLFTCAVTPGSRSIHDVVLGSRVVYHYRADELAADEV